MDIRRIESGKRDFLPLLLLGDEQEDMIDRYLDRGTLLALYDGGLRAVCVVTKDTPPGGHRGQSPHPPLLPGLRVPGKPPGPQFLPSILRPPHIRRGAAFVGHGIFVHGALSGKGGAAENQRRRLYHTV